MGEGQTAMAQTPAAPLGIGPSVGEPVWLQSPHGTLLGFLHPAVPEAPHPTGVLICPPFGWEEEKSYRGRRTWADELARAGYPALRIDLPGTGDSAGSPRDPARLEAWTAAVGAGARWLRARTGCDRVVAIGIGLGGLLAWRAATAGAPIDDLVLWAVPDTGKRLLREIRIQAGIVSDQQSEQPPGTADTHPVGYLLTLETQRELLELRLADLPLPDPASRRALVLTREGLGADRAVAATLEQAGAAVEVADVGGYDELMVDAELSKPPVAAIAASLAWLGRGGGGARRPADGGASEPLTAPDRLELPSPGGAALETITSFDWAGKRLFGILSEPAEATGTAPLGVILVNAGGVRRTGPNRNWVEVARRWAGRGVPVVRFDLAGIGDTDGDPRTFLEPGGPYTPERIAQVGHVVDELHRRGLAERFVVVGLCTGAYLAMHAAIASSHVAAAYLVNQNVVFWEPDVAEESSTVKALESLRGRTWRKLLSGDVTAAEIRAQAAKLAPRRVLAAVRPDAGLAERTDAALDQLRERGTDVVLVFGQQERLYDRLRRDGQLRQLDRWPNVTLVQLATGNTRVPVADHTLRTLALQRELHERLDEALDRTLARVPESTAG